MECILCKEQAHFYVEAEHFDRVADYYHCQNCDLVFLSPQFFLKSEEEANRYKLHKNDINDLGYLKFVQPLIDKMISSVTKMSSVGLDYGCGPGPIIAKKLRESGYSVSCYDPYYADDKSLLEQNYTYIFSNEVVEHFYNPAAEFHRLYNLLSKKGHLFLGTQIRGGDVEFFKNWYYRRDPTHVCFYSVKTMQWLADQYNMSLEILMPRIAVLQRLT